MDLSQPAFTTCSFSAIGCRFYQGDSQPQAADSRRLVGVPDGQDPLNDSSKGASTLGHKMVDHRCRLTQIVKILATVLEKNLPQIMKKSLRSPTSLLEMERTMGPHRGATLKSSQTENSRHEICTPSNVGFFHELVWQKRRVFSTIVARFFTNSGEAPQIVLCFQRSQFQLF
jgi:hypothetical protein